MTPLSPGRQQQTALIFGARNLGRAIIERLIADGWNVAGSARSQETLSAVQAAGAMPLEADVTDPAAVEDALERVASRYGNVDLVVNAASAYGGRREGPFGGGPLAEAAADAFDAWAAAPARSAFSFLSASARFLRRQGRPAAIVQVTGGSSRRAMPGRGLWAAGAFGVRALTQAAALELRAEAIHVALLIVDAGIEPLSSREGRANMADPRELAAAVAYIGSQSARGFTHELQITPGAETWVP
jgi:NAD(P)-dependent dehydrogenase (short-subunit alcohol dehydrogenase family)